MEASESMSESALSYIQTKGLEYREQAGQVVLKMCPFCGDGKGHFYMDPKEGAFFCHKCNEKGNLITLKKHFGDYDRQGRNYMQSTARKQVEGIRQAFPEKGKAYPSPDEKKALQAHERLLGDALALSYVTDTRGISLEAGKHFKLGLEIDRYGIRWLTIPHYENGKLINVKSRRFPPIPPDVDRFKRDKGCRSILFNADILEENQEEVILCEGEIDAISLWDHGLKNVVTGTTGAGSFDSAWIDQLAKVKKIILCLDPDEAGQKGARELARRLGYDRCFNVTLPDGQDVNDFFTSSHDLFDFQALLNQAKKFDVAGILSFSDALEDYQRDLSAPSQREVGIRTGWPSVDRIIKTGFMPGELVVLSAPPKIGKSSFGLQIVTNNALHDIPGLFFCLEMRPRKITEKIIQCWSKGEEPGDQKIEQCRKIFTGKPLYLGYSYQKPTLDGIMDTLKAAIRRYGLKLVCFDHLHFLCRSITNQVQEVGLAVQAFKFLAEELEVPVILIAQPRKIQTDSIMTAMDLKDSSSIFSDCDHLIILHRQRRASAGKDLNQGSQLQQQAFDPVTLVRVEASRYGSGGETLLYFRGEYSRFDEIQRRSE